MNYTLLIYELIPEETRMYAIPNQHITPEYRSILEQSHGAVANAGELTEEEDAANRRIQVMIGSSGNEEDYVRYSPEDFLEAFGVSVEEHKRLNSLFLPFKIDHTKPITQGPITNVYWTGFYC
jgi:hypothetical protein